jgi:hypothetical protein
MGLFGFLTTPRDKKSDFFSLRNFEIPRKDPEVHNPAQKIFGLRCHAPN